MWERLTGTQIESCTQLYPGSLARKKWGALEAPWQMTPIRAPFVCSKACDIVGEDAFSVASLHSSILFLRPTGTADKNLNGYICGFRTEIGRSKNSHFAFLNIARRPHTTQSDLHLSSLNLSRASCMYGRVGISIDLLSCVQGADMSIPTCSSEKSPLAWQSFCADTSPKLEVSTPCPKRKRSREDAILKRQGIMFQPSFSKAKCELLRPGQSGVLRNIAFQRKKRWIFRTETVITMQARNGELWWSTLAHDSYSSDLLFLRRSMWHCRRRC